MATRTKLALLLALLSLANALVLHLHVGFSACPMTRTSHDTASRVLVIAIGNGRIGATTCQVK